MKTGLGVWIDHRDAVIAGLDGAWSAEGLRRITTDLEKQLRLSSGARGETAYGPQSEPSDDMRLTSSRENLNAFFGAVEAALRGAPAIFLFGPGEAKDEFRKRLERDGLGARIDGVETAGRMTDRQIAAKAREHFAARADAAAGAGTTEEALMTRSEKSRGGMHGMDGRPTAQDRSAMNQKLSEGRVPELAEAAVAVDFPAAGERVASREYTFRITARAEGEVEISIDEGPWLPCRRAVGFWWHDWSGYAAGEHSVSARVHHGKRRGSISERRQFAVRLA
jgi:hypothetical protein